MGTAEGIKRELLTANLFLFGLLGVGGMGYMIIEGWTWADSLYMTFLTVTTIGFSEVQTLSAGGRAFTMLVGLGGIGTVAFIATRSAQILMNTRSYQERTTRKMIEKTSNHYIVCGFGRIGSRIVADLESKNIPFVVIEKAPDKLNNLADFDWLVVEGDAEDEEVLRRAGIERAKGMILTLPEDSANVFVTLVAREMNPDLFILARTDKNQNKRKLLRAGADTVVSPYEIGADRMSQVILQPKVDEFMQGIRNAESMSLVEVEIEKGSLLADNTLAGSEYGDRFEAIVVAMIQRETGEMVFNPKDDVGLMPGDSLVVLGSSEMVQRLRSDGCTSSETI